MKVDTKASSIRFVYPFLFKMEEFAERVRLVEGATWPGGKQTLNVWQPMEVEAHHLLSCVGDFVNPTGEEEATARLWSLDGNALHSVLGGGLTNPGAEWTLVIRKRIEASPVEVKIPFRIEAVQLSLFQIGVGFLSICATPTVNSKDDWLDFLYYFRFIQGSRNLRVQARRKVGLDPVTREELYAPFFPSITGGLEKHPDGAGSFSDIMLALLNSASSQPAEAPWWQEIYIRGQLLPFVTLYVDGIEDADIPTLLYRTRNIFRSSEVSKPAPEELRLDHPSLMPYAERQWFLFSLDGGAFVACNAPQSHFMREILPAHLDSRYFILFLLALQQRFGLMMISGEIAKHWRLRPDLPNLPKAHSETIQDLTDKVTFIRMKMLWFAARGYFAQVMQQEHHQRCYLKWQETFQVPRLYTEVSDKARDLYGWMQAQHEEHIQRLAEEQRRLAEKLEKKQRQATDARERKERRQAERQERFLSAIAFLIGVPALAMTYLQALGRELDGWFVLWVGLGALLAGSLMFAIFLLVNYLIARGKDASA